jgi:hypothetical protein
VLWDLSEVLDDTLTCAYMRQLLDVCGSRLAQHCDMQRLLLMGHSRGGKLSCLIAEQVWLCMWRWCVRAAIACGHCVLMWLCMWWCCVRVASVPHHTCRAAEAPPGARALAAVPPAAAAC